MTCSKAQRYISEYVDGALDARKAAELERHLKGCPACREVLEDFRAMAEAASDLENPEPNDAVWSRIRSRLAAAGPVSVPGRRALGWNVPAWRFAGATALALILVASGIYVGSRLRNRGVAAYPRNSEQYTLAKLDEAQKYYEKAIKSLSEAFAGQKNSMIPQVVEMFERNLTVIDNTIQACRQAVLKEPDDLQARNYLLAAYMDKVMFLDSALESQKGAPGTGTRGKSL